MHGGCSLLPIIKPIMDVVTQPNVGVCWNCNGQDLRGRGLGVQFQARCGRVSAISPMSGSSNLTDYPYQQTSST